MTVNNQEPLLLRVGEVCARLGMSRSTIYREIENGNLRAFKIGKSVRISADEVIRYVERLNSLEPVK